MNAEVRQFKEQKEEALRFQKLSEEKRQIEVQEALWKLYHIEEKMEAVTKDIGRESKNLQTLEEKQVVHRVSSVRLNGLRLLLETDRSQHPQY